MMCDVLPAVADPFKRAALHHAFLRHVGEFRTPCCNKCTASTAWRSTRASPGTVPGEAGATDNIITPSATSRWSRATDARLRARAGSASTGRREAVARSVRPRLRPSGAWWRAPQVGQWMSLAARAGALSAGVGSAAEPRSCAPSGELAEDQSDGVSRRMVILWPRRAQRRAGRCWRGVRAAVVRSVTPPRDSVTGGKMEAKNGYVVHLLGDLGVGRHGGGRGGALRHPDGAPSAASPARVRANAVATSRRARRAPRRRTRRCRRTRLPVRARGSTTLR